MRHREQSVYPLSRCLSPAVNVTPNEKDFFPGSFSYLRVPVNDSASVCHPPTTRRRAASHALSWCPEHTACTSSSVRGVCCRLPALRVSF